MVEWMPCGAYFGSVRAAVEHVARDAERNRSANVGADLAGALDVMRQIERDIGRHADRFERAMEVGMRCLLRQEIVDAYEKFIVDEKPISVERKREVIEAYEAYHDLGGDGLITDMYEEIKEKDTYIVK